MNETLSFVNFDTEDIMLPVGTIIPYAGIGELNGFLDCDGSAVSRTTYSNLFQAIGTTYGEGDGSTTFNLPNCINKTLWGGLTPGAVKQAGLPNVTGTLNFARGGDSGDNTYYVYADETASDAAWNNNKGNIGALAGRVHKTATYNNTNIATTARTGGKVLNAIQFNASKSNSIYGGSTTVQPPALVFRILIKY